MEVIYNEEDQKKIDFSNHVIQEYQKRLIQALKAQTHNEREISKRFIQDYHRRMLIKSKVEMIAVMIPTFRMTISK
jgi:hypothetical protein